MPLLADTEFRQLLGASPDAVLIVDRDGMIRELNPRAARLFHVTRRQLLGRPVERLIPSRLRRAHRAYRTAYAAAPTVRPMSKRSGLLALRADGVEFPVEISLTPLFGARRGMVMAVVRDISARVRMEQALYTERLRAQVTLASIADGVITTDASGRVDYLNAAAEALSGWTNAAAHGRRLKQVLRLRDEITGRAHEIPHITDLPAPAHAPHAEAVLLARVARRVPIEYSAAPLRNETGNAIGAVIVFRDVTVHHQLTDRLRYEATHDALTGLVNRAEFERRLVRVLANARLDQSQHALGYIDLDGFKAVNDTFGHSAGDALLRELGRALGAQVRHRDTLGRVGGDEFGLLLEHCPPKRARRRIAALMRAVSTLTFQWDGQPVRIAASAGLVEVNANSGTAEHLLRDADAACYSAKRHRRLSGSRRCRGPTRC